MPNAGDYKYEYSEFLTEDQVSDLYDEVHNKRMDTEKSLITVLGDFLTMFLGFFKGLSIPSTVGDIAFSSYGNKSKDFLNDFEYMLGGQVKDKLREFKDKGFPEPRVQFLQCYKYFVYHDTHVGDIGMWLPQGLPTPSYLRDPSEL